MESKSSRRRRAWKRFGLVVLGLIVVSMILRACM
jgi:hypothetical protein